MGGHIKARKSFIWEGYRYEIYDTQLDHPDFDSLFLAWRIPENGGKRSRVTLKRLSMSRDREARERSWEELQLATHLRHPNIAQVHGLASDGEASFVVMESMHGLYLLTVLDFVLLEKGSLSPAFAAYVAAEVADALHYAHECKDGGGNSLHIIHRAVSPIRIRLGFHGQIKLTNFGAAYSDLRGRKPSPLGVFRGDPAYCAPEVLRAVIDASSGRRDPLISGAIDGRADVFSLGLILLEMLVAEYPLDPTGQIPANVPKGLAGKIRAERPAWIDFDSLADRLFRFDLAETERLTGDVPEALRKIIRRALQPDPSRRCSAGELRDELRAYLNGLARPYDSYALEEDLTGVYGRALVANSMAGKPLERTALVLDGKGGTRQ